ncbi:hypothetical protein [Novosphingobium clariflavum]|uniref:Uncharacterized protein n=1 Tax=Novosphingobium clariflavum TaxID=2029884 RepID=A0ABV6SD23_9SPHN|nr:hypothetical protein [Novosphingobium clariflavum]
MDDAFAERCGDGHDDRLCPICRGEMSEDFIEMIEQAGAAEPSRRMSGEEFVEWLHNH